MKKLSALLLSLVMLLSLCPSIDAFAWNKLPTTQDPPSMLSDRPETYWSPFDDGALAPNKEPGDLPPLGLNTWNAFGSDVTEQIVMDMADSFVRLGLDKLGYEYIVVDDGCYAAGNARDADGRMLNHPVKFPSGFKALADYVHSRGLKYGMYQDVGTSTCNGNHSGTWGREDLDALTFAQWGVDYVKYDYCNNPWDTTRYNSAPNIRSIRVTGADGFNVRLLAATDGTIGPGTKSYANAPNTSSASRNTSGEGYVQGITTNTTTSTSGDLTFTVTAQSAGKYSLSVEYAGGANNARWLQTNVNGKRVIDELVSATSNNTTFAYTAPIEVDLIAGANTIRIYNEKRREVAMEEYGAFADGLYKAYQATGRRIHLSLCDWGNQQPWLWGYKVGLCWRTTTDIVYGVDIGAWNDSSRGIKFVYDRNVMLDDYAGLDKGWNDPDMLVVGNKNRVASIPSTVNGRFSFNEDESHFNSWAMMNSAIMLGTDLRRVGYGDDVWQVIANKDIIDLNQDPLGIQAKRIKIQDQSTPNNPDPRVQNTNSDRIDFLAKPLANGDVALMIFNLGSTANSRTGSITIDEIINGESQWHNGIGHKMVNKEAFASAEFFKVSDLGAKSKSTFVISKDAPISATLMSHASKTYRISPISGAPDMGAGFALSVSDSESSSEIIATFTNNNPISQPANVIIAAYNNKGAMVKTVMNEAAVAPGGSLSVSIDKADYAGCAFKAFAWEPASYVPLCGAVTYDAGPEFLRSLAGVWGLKLGSYVVGENLSDSCVLPGTLDENQKGTLNTATNTSRLNRKYTYTGSAVYQKSVYIPESWEGKSYSLMMERTKITRVWVNNAEQLKANANNTLGAAQVYDITGLIPGEVNKITIQVTNNNYPVGTGCHMLTDETVTNWNGILGRIELKATDKVFIKDVLIYPDINANAAKVKVIVQKDVEAPASGTFTISATSYNHAGATVSAPSAAESFAFDGGAGEKEFSYTYDMGDDVKLWSEFEPSLYKVAIGLSTDGDGFADSFETSFGMREFKTSGTQFTINGIKTFMRGEGNSAVFPLTGYAFMTKAEWLDFFGKSQALGINMFRFHSWTPPEVAFDAADELGIYMQPELYGFGGNPFNQYYTDEAGRVLKYLANHPSFVMYAWGNELGTDTTSARNAANALRTYCRGIDDTRLYAEGSNNNYWNVSFNTGDDYWTTCKTRGSTDPFHIRLSFAWVDASSGGILESTQPNSIFNYSSAIAGFTKPIMNHEAGQYQVLPNFNAEIPKYQSGIFEARNLMSYRDAMIQKGIMDMNEKFSMATARTSAIGYRADIEAALKTPGFGGYQLLSIQDFPGQGTAHVGILDNFMDEKPGGFTSEQYKSFNDSVVILGNLPKYIYSDAESLTADAIVVNYGPTELKGLAATWALKKSNGSTFASGSLSPKDVAQGSVTNLGGITAALSGIAAPEKLELVFSAPAIDNSNSYSIWVYPSTIDTAVPSSVHIANAFDEQAEDVLAAGGTVLLLPPPTRVAMPKSVKVRWTNDYWSKMFHNYSSDDAYTMGMYIEENHPVFRDFPTEYFNDYQWFNLMKNSRAVILDGAPLNLKPMAQNIDHMDRCYRLGSLFEAKVGAGSLLVCTFDLLGQMDKYPEAKQLYSSILKYMASNDFDPKAEMTATYLQGLFADSATGGFAAYKRIEGEDHTVGSKSFGLEYGTGPGASEAALGGISSGNWIKFENVKFGDNGSEQIIVCASNNNTAAAQIQVRLDSNTGTLLASLNFVRTSGGWSVYQQQTFDFPRLTGNHDIVLVFVNGGIALNFIQFVETAVVYINPYGGIEPEVCKDIQGINGGAFNIKQLSVSDITGEVVFKWPNVDFGPAGSSKVAIHGYTENDYVDAEIRYKDAGADTSIPIRFMKNAGAAYELQTEIFYKQEFAAIGIKGVQNLEIAFKPGTSFNFEYLCFESSATAKKSAYTITYARDYDSAAPAVNLERTAPNQVVGSFNPGGRITYKGLDFGSKGPSKIILCGANASTYADLCGLRIRYGETEYFEVGFPQTGGWGAANDRAIEFDVPASVSITGVRDITIEMTAGGLAFNYFNFIEK